MAWYLYIAEAATGNYYIGISTDVERRIGDHNKGKGSRMAMSQGPFTLRYASLPLPDRSTALKLEIAVKKWSRERKQRLVHGEIVLPELPGQAP